MIVPLSLVLTISIFGQYGQAQIAAVFSSVEQHPNCATWSSWGSCIWLQGPEGGGASANTYLDQLTPECQQHWFYNTIRKRFGTALNNFFQYLKDVTVDDKPCGMCSYRQSCGYGGEQQCHLTPWQANRPVAPFNVAEQVCIHSDMDGHQQNGACHIKYAPLLQNGGECQLWPSQLPNLDEIQPDIREVIYRLKWANCVPDNSEEEDGKPKYCRCCCFPFQPVQNGDDFKCVHMGRDKAPEVPGLERLRAPTSS